MSSSHSSLALSSRSSFLRNDELMQEVPSCCVAVHDEISKIERRVQRIEKAALTVIVIASILLLHFLGGVYLDQEEGGYPFFGISLFGESSYIGVHFVEIDKATKLESTETVSEQPKEANAVVHPRLHSDAIHATTTNNVNFRELRAKEGGQPQKSDYEVTVDEDSNGNAVNIYSLYASHPPEDKVRSVSTSFEQIARREEYLEVSRRTVLNNLWRRKSQSKRDRRIVASSSPLDRGKWEGGRKSFVDKKKGHLLRENFPNGDISDYNEQDLESYSFVKFQTFSTKLLTTRRTRENSTYFTDAASFDWYSSGEAAGDLSKEQCQDGQALLEIEINYDHTSSDFSWMIRNETVSKSGPDSDNIIFQIHSPKKKEAMEGTRTYPVCLQQAFNSNATYSLTLFDRYQNATADYERYSIKVDGEVILSGGSFEIITSRWFKYSPVVTSFFGNIGNVASTSNAGNISKSGFHGSRGNWMEVKQPDPKCTDDSLWDGELFSATSMYTDYRFDRRISELTDIVTSISGAHNLWPSEHRRRALCWLLHDDKRQISSNDPLLFQRYAMAVLFYALHAQHIWFLELIFRHSGNECHWLSYDYIDWNGPCVFQMDGNGGNSYIGGVHIRQIYIYEKYGRGQLSGTLPHEMFSAFKYLDALIILNQNITGTIPSEIGLSTELMVVGLGSNDLRGTIPSDIGKLSALQGLALTDNNLEGTISSSLFASNSNLREINLSDNYLNFTIPHSVGNAEKLMFLFLQRNNLSGMIPLSLFTNCLQLQSLNLGGNSLSGTLPDGIRNLQNLNDVSFTDNKLSGSLPSGLGHLSHLQYLSLEQNEFDGSLASDIFNASNLVRLEISRNQLTGSIPSDIGKLTRLSLIDFTYNHFEGEIPNSLWSIPLKTTDRRINPGIDLRKNPKLYGNVPTEFCDKLANGRVLVDDSSWMTVPQVNCSCCDHCDEGGRIRFNCAATKDCDDRYNISSWILLSSSDDVDIIDVETNRTIRNAFVTSFFYSDEYYGEEDFFIDLPVMGCYRAIFYSSIPDDEGNGLFSFPPFRIKFKDRIIAQMDSKSGPINKNYVAVEFGLSIKSSTLGPIVFERRPVLEARSCDAVPYICDGMTFETGTPERRMLNHLSHVGLMGDYASILFDPGLAETKALCFVVRTSLSEQLTRKELDDKICTGQLLQLYVLAVLMFNNHAWEKENVLEDGQPSPLHFSYCQWPGITCNSSHVQSNYSIVTGIDLSDQNLTGTLPSGLSYLDGLDSLILRNNHLSGTLPNFLPLGLQTLDLGNNQLSGTVGQIPITKLPYLKNLDLSQNLFAGSIQLENDSLKHMKYLNASDNFFTGTVPVAIFQRMQLQHLDLSKNGFTGKLPSKENNGDDFGSIGNMPELETFSVQENELSGALPRWVFSHSSLPRLKNLMLQSNHLTGSIPTEVGLLQKLEILTLSHNSLRGQIPFTYLTNNRSLKKLHLQGNILTGTIALPQLSHLKYSGDKHAFIADCGSPYFSLPSKLRCDSCTICCNSEGMCQDNTPYQKTIVQQTLIFLSSVVVFIFIFILAVPVIRQSFSLPTLEERQFGVLCGMKSMYSLILSSSCGGDFLYCLTLVLQITIFSIFFEPADFRDENSDWQYSKRCASNSVECEDESNVTVLGWFMFGVVLLSKLAVDIFNGFIILYKLVLCCCDSLSLSRSTSDGSRFIHVRIFLSGATLIIITSIAAWTSVVYNRATASTDTELVYNAVILLFVNELDELFYSFVAAVAPKWLEAKAKAIEAISTTFEQTEECPKLLQLLEPGTFNKAHWEQDSALGESETAMEDTGVELSTLDPN